MTLSHNEQTIIKEEEANLRLLQLNYIDEFEGGFRDEILQEITDLNEAIPEVNADDLPQISAQLNRLDTILKQIDSLNHGQLDLMSPYFGHMRLRDRAGIRDLYLGTQVFRTSDGVIQIIDWKTSPIGRIYFLYDEGDEYEEEIEGRLFEGEMLFKRIIRIMDGQLKEIQSGDSVLRKTRNLTWEKADSSRVLLRGGAGSATRPQNTISLSPKLGINASGEMRQSKLLPEITGLIDSSQFELITQPETSVVAVQGLAGSGKTTVALHRIAWLHFQDKRRFSAEKILIIVFNKALSNYVSMVLPSLGIEGVTIEYYERWISKIRRRLYSGKFPRAYSEETPAIVIRFKKHPVLLKLVNEFIGVKNADFNNRLSSILKDQQYRGLNSEMEALPLITRVYTIHEWLEGKRKIADHKAEFDPGTLSQLQHLVDDYIDSDKERLDTVLDYWEEFFSDFASLKNGFLTETEDFSSGQLDQVLKWMKNQYAELADKSKSSKKDLVQIMSGEGADPGEPSGGVLDYEDDAILVYLYQRLFKTITRGGGKRLGFGHIMIDEVQDFSPIELAVMVGVANEPLSLTFAGDPNQKMIKESGFKTWEQTFETLGIKGQKVSALQVGYRSTFEIMEFAFEVLGDLKKEKEFIATRHGPPVQLFQFANQGELIQTLSRNLLELMLYEPVASVALICSTPAEAKALYELLKPFDIKDLRLIDDQNFPFVPGVDVTDVRQVKGLEFDYVILLDVDTVNYRDDSYSRYLLHIAASRAAHQLWIMNQSVSSSLLPSTLLDNSF